MRTSPSDKTVSSVHKTTIKKQQIRFAFRTDSSSGASLLLRPLEHDLIFKSVSLIGHSFFERIECLFTLNPYVPFSMPTLFATALLLFLFSTAASAKPVSVTTIEVDVQSIEERIDTVGQVESLQAPLIASEVTAKVSQILVQIGDSVTVNTPLAQLDTQTYQLNLEKAASEVARLEALVKLQNTQVKRYQTLLKRKGVDQATYDKAMAEKASLIAQKAYAQALHKEAQMTLDKTQILSPIDGVVDQRMVSVGDYVVPGAALFKLVGNHPLRVKLPFSEIYASRIHKGKKST
jgi:multidrug efflux pump subunit AcrA (membrane-fusion protein)